MVVCHPNQPQYVRPEVHDQEPNVLVRSWPFTWWHHVMVYVCVGATIHPFIHVVIGMSGRFAPHHATEAKPTEDRTHHIDQPQTVRQTVIRTDKQRERECAPPAR